LQAIQLSLIISGRVVWMICLSTTAHFQM